MMTGLIGYARVSTVRGQRLDLQIDALMQAGCSRIFQEKVSGASANRPELENCLSYLREGETLVVYKLDRLGRSLRDLIEIITDLKARGIGFKSVSDGIDTTTSAGQLLFHIMGSFAEFERALVLERTNAGLTAARERGKLGGRPRAITNDMAHRIWELRSAGSSGDSIAKELGIGRATVYRYLKSGA